MSVVTYKNVIPEILHEARDHLFWDEREQLPALDSARFILRVMDKGTWPMIEALETAFQRPYLNNVLRHAPIGALSPRSWNFWCLRLGCELPYPKRFPTE